MNVQSALLSNYEVYQLLKDREAEQAVHTRAALVKKERDGDVDATKSQFDMTTLVTENVRTVQFEVSSFRASSPGCRLIRLRIQGDKSFYHPP